MNWEGAELYFYADGESHAVELSDIQFAMIVKLLGLEYDLNEGCYSFFSDETLKQLAAMKGNPLRLREKP